MKEIILKQWSVDDLSYNKQLILSDNLFSNNNNLRRNQKIQQLSNTIQNLNEQLDLKNNSTFFNPLFCETTILQSDFKIVDFPAPTCPVKTVRLPSGKAISIPSTTGKPLLLLALVLLLRIPASTILAVLNKL